MENKDSDSELKNNWTKSVEVFDDLEIKLELLRGIYGYGFVKPSAVQKRAIIPMIEGKDVIVQSVAGSGKSITYLIGTLQVIDESSQQIQALILAPTRELACGLSAVLKGLGEYLKVSVHTCVGGKSVSEDKKAFAEGVQAVVGTPGRIQDMIAKGFLSIQHLKLIVLDEADELYCKGFKDQIESIFKFLPEKLQVGIFSATMPFDVKEISKGFTKDPAIIIEKVQELTLDGIKQYYIALEKPEWKYETLKELFEEIEMSQCMIYCNKNKQLKDLTQKLKEDGFQVSSMDSDMTKEERDQNIKDFRNGSTRIMVSTDLFARGNDISMVSLTINYDFPENKEFYIRRIGRSGAYGKRGIVINFILQSESNSLMEIQKYYNTQIDEMPLDVSEQIF